MTTLTLKTADDLREADADVVGMLQDLLSQAEAGDFTGLAVVVVRPDSSTGHNFASGPHRASALHFETHQLAEHLRNYTSNPKGITFRDGE